MLLLTMGYGSLMGWDHERQSKVEDVNIHDEQPGKVEQVVGEWQPE